MRFSPEGVLAFAFLLATPASGAASPANAPRREPFDVQGHRGARGLLPENTLEAFTRALDLGVSTLELDLGVTRDRQVVVSHDRRLDPKICRRADGTALTTPPPLLRDLDLAEVQTLDCGSLNPDRSRFPEPPRKNVPGARIPTLRQVFALARDLGDGEVRFNLEIKVDPTVDETVPVGDFVDLVLGEVRDAALAPRVTIQSFDWRVLELVKRRRPGLATAALLKPDTLASEWLNGLDPRASGGGLLALLRTAAPWVDVFSPDWRMVAPGTPEYRGVTVREIQAAGFLVVPWTVNRRGDMEALLAAGVDGLITDYPDVLIDLLRDQRIPVR